MKVSIDIDCTPEEARRFLGLPDVQPMQQAVMDRMQQQMVKTIETMDPKVMIDTWLPLGLQNLGDLQKLFLNQFMAGSTGRPADKDRR